MRYKSSARRDNILAAAEEIFCRVGFDAASMSAIASAAGSSKATVYAYFSSKRELFLEMLMAAARPHFQDAMRQLEMANDMVAGLTQLGTAYLTFRSAPRAVALLRLVIAESARSGLGADFYHLGPGRFMAELVGALTLHIERGKLAPGDPALMAGHLKAMIESALLERCLLAETTQPAPAALQQQVTIAVAAFVRCYAPLPAAWCAHEDGGKCTAS